MRLTDIIISKHPIIYLDQTSFRTDSVQKRTWFNSSQRFVVPLARGKDTSSGFTVFGAIGECIEGCFYHEIHESTNARSFE